MNKEKENDYKEFLEQLQKLMDMVIIEHKNKGKEFQKQLTIVTLLWIKLDLR